MSYLLFSLMWLVSANANTMQSNLSTALVADKKSVTLSKKGSDLEGYRMHGFRMGFGYINAEPSESEVLESQWLYLLGYEVNQRVLGGSWVNVLFAQNISIVGLNQGLLIPSGNFLMGFELHERVQLTSGLNVVPSPSSDKDLPIDTRMIAAVGWTPEVGNINIPFHVILIPDVHQKWRGYVTTGVNW
jgi:hypothetical protein